MRRFTEWLRGRPHVVDALLAAVLLVFEIVSLPRSTHPWLFAAVGLAIPLPMLVRRRHPRAAAAALLALSITASLVCWGTGEQTGHPGLLGVGIMLYTLVAYVGRRQAAIYAGCLVADSALSIAVGYSPPVQTAAFGALFYALCWVTGEFQGARRAYDDEVAARLAVAEYDRERSAHEAVAAERTRIARELHDVVAHAVSVMIVQADGATYAMRTDPERAEQALRAIATTGRQALGELRKTVALLRTEHAPEGLPQHGTAGIVQIVDLVRRAGLAVELELTGPLDDVPSPVSLGVHRIVQESLTNSLRHAGQDATAWVRIHRIADEVRVDVRDNGQGSAGQYRQGTGNGLVGMRERVAVLGGTLDAGPRPGGGWSVGARIPLSVD